ncbi:MAG: SMC-Scp complex subunit ScpB [Clostridia bacterium]|nr:SMC-Scp complex subunit ScpB [Clostridia bacterium]
MEKNLPNIIEGILFVSGNGVEIKDIVEKLNVTQDDIEEALPILEQKYSEESGSGINLIRFKDKLQFCTNPDYAEKISDVLNPIRERTLSKTALETIAIIAYQQPITRLEIENIRGVSSDYAIQLLLSHNLIEVVGRKDVVGKPLLFGTTDEFLKRFELSGLEDLPKYDELLEQIKVLNIDSGNQSIYNEFEVVPIDENDPEVELLKEQA